MPDHQYWQPDPLGRHQHRWRRKDGTWGDQVADAGVTGTDPYTGPQLDPEAPSVERAAPEPIALAAPVVEPVRSAAREPLSFWGHAWATAFGIVLSIPILVAGAVGAFLLLSETVSDWP